MHRFTTILGLAALAPLAHADDFIYAAEDGGNSDSSLATFDANATWGNYFNADLQTFIGAFTAGCP